MKLILPLFLLLAAPAIGQSLPSFVAGVGEEWSRGASGKLGTDVTVAQLIGSSSFYVWGNVFTPDVKGTPGNPTPSTITIGGAYVAAQTGRASLVLIVLGGFSMPANGMQAAPAFSGSVGVPIQIARNWAVMPFAKALATGTAVTSANSVSTVLQFGLEFQYEFFAAPKPSSGPTVKQMRAVLRRFHMEQ